MKDIVPEIKMHIQAEFILEYSAQSYSAFKRVQSFKRNQELTICWANETRNKIKQMLEREFNNYKDNVLTEVANVDVEVKYI